MDQDDSMLSTPSSHQDDTYDEDSLFPETTTTDITNSTSYVAAQTPQNDHLNAAAPGELSPPRSHSTGQTNGFGANANNKPNTFGEDDGDFVSDDDEAIDMKGEQSLRSGGKDDKDRPGAGWKNKKAQEEMARAWENVVDRDFDVKVYGDPLAHKK